MNIGLKLVERGFVPDFSIRFAITKLLKQRLFEESLQMQLPQHAKYIEDTLSSGPIAIETRAANEQHYEVPTQFFKLVMGNHMKYSSCFWLESTDSLSDAEEQALSITCKRAELENGHKILELGCGWGSLSLFMAKKFPQSQITSVSNSRTQKQYIEAKCAEFGISNLEIITANMTEFEPNQKFDRVVSVEMFEHMRNWKELLNRIRNWLNLEGKLFVHIFTHQKYTYFFEVKNDSDWMAKYFFTGGVMPSDQLLVSFPSAMVVKQHWVWSGTHYQKTAEAWLQNMDANQQEIISLFKTCYPPGEAKKWWNYWRIFFMACAELWGYNHGKEWQVSHYLLEKK